MHQIFLESAARPLLVLHALVAAAALGASTHLAVTSVGLLRGRAQLGRVARIHSQVIGLTFVAAFALGLLVYPTYRYYVRGLYLDRYAPWASNLFDIKENLAALALPLALALLAVGRRAETGGDRAAVRLVAFLGLALWALTAFAVVSGLVITSVKGL